MRAIRQSWLGAMLRRRREGMTLQATYLSDPDTGATAQPVLIAALDWLQHTVLGTLATTVAIIAVAAYGMLLFTGRIDVRRGLSVIAGCFILFGASAVGVGLRQDSLSVPTVPPARSDGPNVSAVPQDVQPASPFDPYGGIGAP